ncbi:MAG: I78 family peptidase inhibitor [Pseudomonadota bacterium]
MINRTHFGRVVIAVAAVLISGCETQQTPQSPKLPEGCALETYQKLLWRPEAALSEIDIRGVRIIRPNTAVTMDYRPNRTNVVIGKSGRVESVYCG